MIIAFVLQLTLTLPLADEEQKQNTNCYNQYDKNGCIKCVNRINGTNSTCGYCNTTMTCSEQQNCSVNITSNTCQVQSDIHVPNGKWVYICLAIATVIVILIPAISAPKVKMELIHSLDEIPLRVIEV